MMIIIIEGCGTRAERVALSGSGGGGDGTRGAPQTGPLRGSPPRVPPVGPLRQAAGPSPAAGTPRGPPRPFPSAGAMSGAKGRANPGSVGSRKFIITTPPPPQITPVMPGEMRCERQGIRVPLLRLAGSHLPLPFKAEDAPLEAVGITE